MAERLATDVFPFAGVELRITRRDVGTDTQAQSVDGNDSDESDEPFVDPHFFDPDYTVAATTGFCRVWEGAEVLCEMLKLDDPKLPSLKNKKVLELGSGVGLVGIAAASKGAHVMLTDLRQVVDEVLLRNICENAARGNAGGSYADASASTPVKDESSPASNAWLGSLPIIGGNGGTATAQPLDWCYGLDEQIKSRKTFHESALQRRDDELRCGDLSSAAFWEKRAGTPVSDPRRCEIILAAECLWLRELLEPFVNTVFELLTNGDATSCILSFRDRSSKENDENGVRENGASTRDDESGKVLRKETKDTPPESLSTFVPVSDVTTAFRKKGCKWRTLRKSDSKHDAGFHVHVFEIFLEK